MPIAAVWAESNIDLDPDSSRRLLDENFLGYLAMTRASRTAPSHAQSF